MPSRLALQSTAGAPTQADAADRRRRDETPAAKPAKAAKRRGAARGARQRTSRRRRARGSGELERARCRAAVQAGRTMPPVRRDGRQPRQVRLLHHPVGASR